jgi:hypothetical protein
VVVQLPANAAAVYSLSLDEATMVLDSISFYNPTVAAFADNHFILTHLKQEDFCLLGEESQTLLFAEDRGGGGGEHDHLPLLAIKQISKERNRIISYFNYKFTCCPNQSAVVSRG